MGVGEEPEDRPYDETLDAARIFQEIGRSAGEHPVPSEGEPASPSTASHRTLSKAKDKPEEPSIGELFSNLVKMSPPEKIRIEEGTIGSLFKKHIGPARAGKRGTGGTS